MRYRNILLSEVTQTPQAQYLGPLQTARHLPSMSHILTVLSSEPETILLSEVMQTATTTPLCSVQTVRQFPIVHHCLNIYYE